MKEALKTAMTTSISEVLETMFFMTIDLSEDAEPASLINEAGKKLFISKIEFEGKVTGHFLFIVPENILGNMTETFMGLESDEVTQTHLTGTIQETVNMIAGNTFSNLDDQAVFNLDIPELIDSQAAVGDCPTADHQEIFLLIETLDGNLGLRVCFVSD